MNRKLKQSLNRKRLIRESLSDVEDKAKEVYGPVYADAIRGIKRANKLKDEFTKMGEVPKREENPRLPQTVKGAKKLYLSESLFDDFDDEEGSWYESFGIKDLLPLTNGNKDAAEIIWDWYDNEYAYEDFGNKADYINFIEDDIYDMLDAATDPDEIEIVKKALNISEDDDYYDDED